jgi:exonuclease III
VWWESLDVFNFAGVGLLIHNRYSKYVQSVRGYKGRVLRVNLFLRGCFKLCIILCYLPSNHRDKSHRQEIDKYILETIRHHTANNYRIMLLGDFNASPEKLKHYTELNKRIPWELHLIKQLQRLCFVDTYLAFHECPQPTWSSHNASSRIDLIWISADLHLELLYSRQFAPRLYLSDHLVVSCFFLKDNIFRNPSVASSKKKYEG